MLQGGIGYMYEEVETSDENAEDELTICLKIELKIFLSYHIGC